MNFSDFGNNSFFEEVRLPEDVGERLKVIRENYGKISLVKLKGFNPYVLGRIGAYEPPYHSPDDGDLSDVSVIHSLGGDGKEEIPCTSFSPVGLEKLLTLEQSSV